MTPIIDNAHKSVPDTRLPQMPNEVDLGDMRLVLIPPGKCDLRTAAEKATFDVNLGASTHELAVNSDRMRAEFVQPESLCFFPKGTDIRLRANNPLPGCTLEVREGLLKDWIDRSELGRVHRDPLSTYQKDGVAAELARSGIRHLMHAARSSASMDRLTVEALALGIAARGMAQIACRDGDIEAGVGRWNRTGRQIDIDRAIDLIETRLCDSELSIRELADAACLSSSHFSSVFGSMVGETPYAFILRRRAEFARDLIVGTREPLSLIAYDAGFSSQAHMTVVIRKIFGVTPAAMRR